MKHSSSLSYGCQPHCDIVHLLPFLLPVNIAPSQSNFDQRFDRRKATERYQEGASITQARLRGARLQRKTRSPNKIANFRHKPSKQKEEMFARIRNQRTFTRSCSKATLNIIYSLSCRSSEEAHRRSFRVVDVESASIISENSINTSSYVVRNG